MEKINSPFKIWESYALAIVFVITSLYVAINRGSLSIPTFLEKIILIIAFPTAILGLSIQDFVAPFVYYSLVILIEFIYGFLLGWGIHLLLKKEKFITGKNSSKT